MLWLRILYRLACTAVLIAALTATVFQPYNWHLEVKQNRFLLQQNNQGPMLLRPPGGLVPEASMQDAQRAHAEFIERIKQRTQDIPTANQWLAFATSLTVFLLLAVSLLLRQRKGLRIFSLEDKQHPWRLALLLSPLAVGYLFALLFTFGLTQLPRCWEMPRCEPKILVVLLAAMLLFFTLGVLLLEAVCWIRRGPLFDKPDTCSSD